VKTLRVLMSYALSVSFFFLLVPLAIYRLGAWVDREFSIPEPQAWPVFMRLAAVVVFALGTALIVWGIYYIRIVGEGHPEEVLGVDPWPKAQSSGSALRALSYSRLRCWERSSSSF
jgi:hypothetical protein